MENETLKLLEPVPEQSLRSWLRELYNKPVEIERREVLRHRDLSYVERLYLKGALPESLIYKLVLPPWDIEDDLHREILVPSISNSAKLYLTGHYKRITALFLEDFGTNYLNHHASASLAQKLGENLAKMHRSYSYRIAELEPLNILPVWHPENYPEKVQAIVETLDGWHLVNDDDKKLLTHIALMACELFALQPLSLVHGDLFAENIVVGDVNHPRSLSIIDWSWFTTLGAPILDIATLCSSHIKNGEFINHQKDFLEAYCFEAGRSIDDVQKDLKVAKLFERVFFLHWLATRKGMGIEGTTVGHVDDLIRQIIKDLHEAEKSG
ncbi:aminoglycoside phosphotransferase family protein [bacterium]|nr:aminoglycoside phosphotransferase family protein [bacterium]